MKSLIAVFFSLVSICSAFAAFDEAKLIEARKVNAEKKWWGNVAAIDYQLELKGNSPVSYSAMKEGLKAHIIKVYSEAGVKNFDVDKLVNGKSCSLALWTFKFKADLLKDKVALSENPWVYVYLSPSEVDANVKYSALIDGIAAGKLVNSYYVSKCIDFIIQHATTLDEAKAKADLKKLNRIFSPKLISDKANWEPIVAKIRTALETY